VKLSFSGHPPYTPSTDYRIRGYTGLQSHTDQTGLLQLSAVRCSSQQHSGSAASAKQCSQDRSPISKTISCPGMRELHWLPIQHRIEYKVAVLTYKSRSSATAPTYLSRHTKARVSEQTLRSSAVPLLDKPFTGTVFARRTFRCSVPTVWNSLPETIISADSLSVFKSRLKTYILLS